MGQRLSKYTLAPAAVAATNIALAQAPGGAGNLNLNGAAVVAGVGTFDIPRRAYIHSAADDTGRTFTVTGTDRNDRPLVEVIKGKNAGDAITLNDFKTITKVAIDGASAGNVTVGTGATVSSPWFPVDRIGTAKLGIQVDAPGTTTYSVETTNDDPFSAGVGVNPTTPYLTPIASIAALSAKTGSNYGVIDSAVTAVRLTVTAYGAADIAVMKLAPAFADDQM